MRGLELARGYFDAYGAPMLRQEFGDIRHRIAVGLAGEGSECLGFDDVLSQDHDFEPGFCLWITRADAARFGFRLERAYAKLPKEFAGFRRTPLSPAGGSRHGVLIIEEFYTRFLGTPHAPQELRHWLHLPSQSLLCACSGEVFCDELGAFSAVREVLLRGYPEDVRRKKLAAHTAFMAQAGQYNYSRCIARGETGAAQLALFEFVRHAISAVYLLNGRYEPYYKWVYCGLRELEILGELGETLAALSELGNSPAEASAKAEVIEDIAVLLIEAYRQQDLTQASCHDLGQHARSIQDGIRDADLRNLHVMDG